MSSPTEGYVLHTYGPERFVRHAVASVVTLRRHDAERPVALYCPTSHRRLLEEQGLDSLFEHIEELPEEHCSIVGFKHHLHKFMPYDRSLYVDADIVWCRDPEPLWHQLRAHTFTATGLERADFWFGGPKGWGVLVDVVMNRRRRTMERFNLTHLPRVQAGIICCADREVAREVCEAAAYFLEKRHETHFRSRLAEGRSEESCEWSLAMAMSSLNLQVIPWLQGHTSPQLDFIEGLTTYDPEFREVTCRYYTDRFVYSLRGIRNPRRRDFLIKLATRLPGRGDYQTVRPIALHFGWLHFKKPFFAFSDRVWASRTRYQEPLLARVG